MIGICDKLTQFDALRSLEQLHIRMENLLV